MLTKRLFRRLFREEREPAEPFKASGEYWERRYRSGGNSGAGSYRRLARFKAEFLNRFVQKEVITSVIEHGCGDGSQLSLAQYPTYLGFDVSERAVELCESRFSDDSTKSFAHTDSYQGESAPLTISLDVIYHLVEDSVFEGYMSRLFDSSQQFVIVYASNTDDNTRHDDEHVRHRKFSDWVVQNQPGWELHSHTPNKYPFKGNNKKGSFADFYVYQKLI